MNVKGFTDGKGSRATADKLFAPALSTDLATDFVDSTTDLVFKGSKVINVCTLTDSVGTWMMDTTTNADETHEMVINGVSRLVAPLAGKDGVRLARKTQAGSCTRVGIKL
jgi:hypothetical protein